jgi:hypothetical protein
MNALQWMSVTLLLCPMATVVSCLDCLPQACALAVLLLLLCSDSPALVALNRCPALAAPLLLLPLSSFLYVLFLLLCASCTACVAVLLTILGYSALSVLPLTVQSPNGGQEQTVQFLMLYLVLLLFLLRSSYATVPWLSCSWFLPGKSCLAFPVLSCLSRTAQIPFLDPPTCAVFPGLS